MYKLLKQKESVLLGLGGILLVLLIWHVVSALKVISPILLSSPFDVFIELVSFFKEGSIYPDLFASASEFIIGFAFALFWGLTLGYIVGWYRKIRSTSSVLIFALYSTPIIALIPLIILWFGFGLWSKVIIIFLASFFPILINVIDAVKNTDQNLLKLAESYKASDLKTIKEIVIPNSIPNVITGIKIAMPRGLIGMIVGEFFTGSVGLGYLISYYGATFQTARLLAVVILIIIISVFLSFCIDILEKKIKHWDM
jgi:NitT/TauT family transport system permease protein